jgi:hypothetical protein
VHDICGSHGTDTVSPVVHVVLDFSSLMKRTDHNVAAECSCNATRALVYLSKSGEQSTQPNPEYQGMTIIAIANRTPLEDHCFEIKSKILASRRLGLVTHYHIPPVFDRIG